MLRMYSVKKIVVKAFGHFSWNTVHRCWSNLRMKDHAVSQATSLAAKKQFCTMSLFKPTPQIRKNLMEQNKWNALLCYHNVSVDVFFADIGSKSSGVEGAWHARRSAGRSRGIFSCFRGLRGFLFSIQSGWWSRRRVVMNPREKGEDPRHDGESVWLLKLGLSFWSD